MDLNIEESFINQSKNISQVDKKIENLKISGQFKENINKVENKNNHFEDINLLKEKDDKKDFGSMVRDEIIKSNLQNNQSKKILKNKTKTKVKIKESKMKKVLLMMGILFEEDIMVEII